MATLPMLTTTGKSKRRGEYMLTLLLWGAGSVVARDTSKCAPVVGLPKPAASHPHASTQVRLCTDTGKTSWDIAPGAWLNLLLLNLQSGIEGSQEQDLHCGADSLTLSTSGKAAVAIIPPTFGKSSVNMQTRPLCCLLLTLGKPLECSRLACSGGSVPPSFYCIPKDWTNHQSLQQSQVLGSPWSCRSRWPSSS